MKTQRKRLSVFVGFLILCLGISAVALGQEEVVPAEANARANEGMKRLDKRITVEGWQRFPRHRVTVFEEGKLFRS